MSFKCPICDNEYEKIVSLSTHFRKLHKGTSKKLYVFLFHGGKEPTCACGCGSEVKFLDTTRGFRNFVWGHAARVPGKNNWGNNNEAQEKSQKTRKKMWQEGELEIWNKGLTKETNKSIAKYGKTGSKTIRSNPKEIKTRTERMRKNRLDGTIPTLHGKEHSQWKDGTSSLHNYCHGNPLLHKTWKTPKIIKAKYMCQHCNKIFKRNQLHVHHNKERMCDIIRTVASQCGWAETIHSNGLEKGMESLKSKISNLVAEYHVNNNVSGIVLCEECHSIEHGRPIISKTSKKSKK